MSASNPREALEGVIRLASASQPLEKLPAATRLRDVTHELHAIASHVDAALDFVDVSDPLRIDLLELRAAASLAIGKLDALDVRTRPLLRLVDRGN